MSKRIKNRYKEKFQIRERQHLKLSEEEYLKIIANLIVDRILEESNNGTLQTIIPNKQKL